MGHLWSHDVESGSKIIMNPHLRLFKATLPRIDEPGNAKDGGIDHDILRYGALLGFGTQQSD